MKAIVITNQDRDGIICDLDEIMNLKKLLRQHCQQGRIVIIGDNLESVNNFLNYDLPIEKSMKAINEVLKEIIAPSGEAKKAMEGVGMTDEGGLFVGSGTVDVAGDNGLTEICLKCLELAQQHLVLVQDADISEHLELARKIIEYKLLTSGVAVFRDIDGNEG